MKLDIPLDIPEDQLATIGPVVDSLLARLREITGSLTVDQPSALVYELAPEAAE